MKANNGKGNVEARDNWRTPEGLFSDLNRLYYFDLDCCADFENAKCSKWSADFKNCYVDPSDVCWMNPPFSKAEEMFTLFFEKVYQGVAIYRCDNMETSIWQNIILANANWIYILKGRLNYEGHTGKGARFPSALIGYGLPSSSILLLSSINGTLLTV